MCGDLGINITTHRQLQNRVSKGFAPSQSSPNALNPGQQVSVSLFLSLPPRPQPGRQEKGISQSWAVQNLDTFSVGKQMELL